jgi:hypothetical protein
MKNENSKLEILRKKYPRFIYEGYRYKISGPNLEIFFDFRVPPDISFKPKIIIKNVNEAQLKRIGDRALENLIFHLGLMEIPSYWKATCSPIIEIRASYLNKEQINFWKDLIIKGMGQFFYENKIDFRGRDFLKIIAQKSCGKIRTIVDFLPKHRNSYLVPVGGGKDSAVTLENLKKKKARIGCFLVNPAKTAIEVVRIAGIKDVVVVERKIDKKLLELNKKGFLNGHTPFTAVLSFLSVFCAALFGYKNIVFSNEKSADEGNVRYLDKIINHQWSKSSEFERKFRNYCKKYLTKDINYFSYLRKYTELEISRMFTKYPKYFSVFSSCNRVVSPPSLKLRRVKWCGNCPKCLFVYATLYPFLEKKILLKIFGRDIFQNRKLLPTMKSLIGQVSHKPFECVGTYRESKKAFQLSLQRAKKSRKIPFLLQKLSQHASP